MPVIKRKQNLYNSDDAINHNFDLKTHENDDYSNQELFVDEDEGDDNASNDEELHCQKSVACGTKCGSLVLNAVKNRCEKFSLWHGLTKNLGGNATVKDFFNKFLDHDYLDLNCLLCRSVPLIQR